MEQIDAIREDLTISIHTIDPTLTYNELAPKFVELCDLINQITDESMDDIESEELWCLGENSYASITDLIIGAFWHYTEWHSGQDSDGYKAYCALSTIYDCGMTSAPDETESEWATYHSLGELAQE